MGKDVLKRRGALGWLRVTDAKDATESSASPDSAMRLLAAACCCCLLLLLRALLEVAASDRGAMFENGGHQDSFKTGLRFKSSKGLGGGCCGDPSRSKPEEEFTQVYISRSL